ncbi:MAG: DUF3105 domain-containing protein [Rubrobacter sp.]|nr:DUF3105 domain-containing protein [Rubrobacter sp.]
MQLRTPKPSKWKILAPFLALTIILAAACGGTEEPAGNGSESGEETSMMEETGMSEETTMGEAAGMDLSQLEVGPDEESSMMPAEGIEKAEAQPLPEDPPEGIEVYDAMTNELVEDASYDRSPPTNGDHDPLWQNCGFYDEPIDDATAVHSLDHGVVWITYSPDLPADEIETLREYGAERYVIISPYPGQNAPVTATSWRIQLELDGAEDPRLRQFVDDFRVSEIAPLSGNGCTRGAGAPAFSG